MMIVIGIDPGHQESAYLLWDGSKVIQFGKWANCDVLKSLTNVVDGTAFLLAIERIQSMGMAVGEEVFESCRWEARFAMAWGDKPCLLIPRIKVKMHHCGDSRAKDANIRQSLVDRFGGKDKAIGKKKTPGVLYGVSGDCWSALAIATTIHDVGEKFQWNLDQICQALPGVRKP